MHQTARTNFNQTFSEEKYQQLLAAIQTDFPDKLDFRVAESPVFIPRKLGEQMVEACEEIISTIAAPDFIQKTDRAIPAGEAVPNENGHTSFLAIDFAVCQDQEGQLVPQLIELQGFPSMFGYQLYLSELYRKHFSVPSEFSYAFGVNSPEEYVEKLKRTILADEHPENVILLEIYPEQQKTRIDFAITEQLVGVKAICYTRLIKEGRRLYYEQEGRKIQVRRIYNRLIFDDLKNFPDLPTGFHFTDKVDVTWVGHPNWFFRISKFTLPLLQSRYVPDTRYVSDYGGNFPDDLENWVLKPLFSFAGTGVELHVTPEVLQQIEDPHNYILQRKVVYAPVIEAPDGRVKCEIRMLYVWPDADERPTLLTSLSRLSRGEMIGVRFNKDFTWVGGSACFFEPF
ncbi:hypothetical protein [Telluribacter sp.]|jgi:hypothetical protein|uniref:hypothetical protein n=1 Tax=Telluribacter sp. TaxID=1978767 RepID=UPI002E14E37F|nr:hypothetical protein [Telluribacter sp.]